MTEFRILGALEALEGERLLPLGAGKQRATLAVLLLHANEVLAADRLIDELWGENQPATARKALQVYVSRLRKALGAERIATRGPRQGPGDVSRRREDRGSRYLIS